MRYELKSYDDFCFTLEVIRFGAGLTGLAPTIKIKRFIANEYWDGSIWDSSVTTFNMSEVDSVNLPGLYVYDFSIGVPTAIDTSVDNRYIVNIEESTQPISEYILVTLNRVTDVVDANIVDWNSTSATLSKNTDSNLPEVTVAHNTDYVKYDIANGILNSDIWNPIVDPTTLATSPSDRDTLARAVTSTYLSSVYKSKYDSSKTEDTYTCTYTSADKFYSSSLPSILEMEKLVKQDAILFKGWSGSGVPTMADWESFKMKIVGFGIDTNGKYLTLEDSTGSAYSYTSGSDSIIIKIQNTASPEEIAEAVWEEPVDSHSTPGTFGLLNRVIAGLVHLNHRIKDTEYDQKGRLTGCRVVVYPTALDAEADTNPLSTIIINSTYNSGNNMVSYLATGE
jgi:hypothetical protein